jgi:uncharacterized membrane protein YeaQ/YmgE (transglycosylase-associated protein family)
MKEVSLMKNNKKRCFLFAILGAIVGAIVVFVVKNFEKIKDKVNKR